MKDIDIEPRQHSSHYELKPMSRWWFVLAVVFTAVMAWASGPFESTTWAMFGAGGLVVGFAVLCFPRFFLTKN